MDGLIIYLFLAAFGASVGSFINVVAFRLPEGQSIHWPPSMCPKCKTSLRWWENVPVFAWLYLRGKCRTCRQPISPQYPIVEAVSAALFVLIFYFYYSHSMEPSLHSPFAFWGVGATWPVYVVHLVLIAGLLAATLIDARLYIIPLQIPWLITFVALAALPIYGWFNPEPILQHGVTDSLLGSYHVTPFVSHHGINFAIGGMTGLGLSLLLLYMRIIPRSFDDEEARQLDSMGQPGEETQPPKVANDVPLTASEPQEKQGQSQAQQELSATEKVEMFLTYSHPRREVMKESLFVFFPFVGAFVGLIFLPPLTQGAPPVWLGVLGGVCCGYLVGGAMVWLTRILGTLGFGREAMGLGDVHLLAAIGAVIDPWGAVLTFFVAPFLGLTYVIIGAIVSKALHQRQVRVIPYGPYLAGAAVIVMVARMPILGLLIHR